MRLCLVVPPFTQLNTPYPSIAYLARFLKGKGMTPELRDFSIELALRVFSKEGLTQIFDQAEQKEARICQLGNFRGRTVQKEFWGGHGRNDRSADEERKGAKSARI